VNRKQTIVRAALFAIGIASVGATALPLINVWQRQAEEANIPAVAGIAPATSLDQPTQIVVDLKDNATTADIAEVQRRIGVPLYFNSLYSGTDKLMVATLPTASAAQNALSTLQGDGNVEAAEPEMTYSIPEMSPRESVEMQAIAVAQADQQAVVIAKQSAVEAAQAANYNAPLLATVDLPVQQTFEVHLNAHAFRVNSTGQWLFDAYRYSPPLNTDTTDNRTFGGTKPNDPLYDAQWNFRMVGAEDAWKKTKGKGVVVAVIDTGVAAKTTKKGNQCKDFGTTSFTKGYDFVNKDSDPYDDHGHGTHVAGTIAESTNNNEGAAGLAYESTIMPLKVLSAQGSGYSSDIADAIRYAADNGANVINMSLGSSQPSSVIHKACQYAVKKGVTIVCAAGNGFGEPVGYPAAFPECIAVSSVGPSGKIATYSSYGKEVALAAPGGDMMESSDPKDGILQNTVMKAGGNGRGRGDDYYAFQGTSMASPHVAAVAALIEAQGVKDPARVREVLTRTAMPNGEKLKYGAGILSAASAVSMAGAETGFKLRHLFLIGFAFLFVAIGPRRSLKVRAAMAGALGIGFFGPDWASNYFGANSPWNLLTFSAILPLGAVALMGRNVRAAKVAAAFSLGVAVNLWAGWHNNLTPFTPDMFGYASTGWTLANMGAAFVLANIAAWRGVSLVNKSAEVAK